MESDKEKDSQEKGQCVKQKKSKIVARKVYKRNEIGKLSERKWRKEI